MTGKMLELSLMEARYVVCRFGSRATIPAWADGEGLVSITRTQDELSIICPESRLPREVNGKAELGWRCLRLHGPFDFAAVGILASVAQPIAEEGVGIFALSTFDTDYVLVKEHELGHAVAALRRAGHTVHATA
jgi:hypothetical protein